MVVVLAEGWVGKDTTVVLAVVQAELAAVAETLVCHSRRSQSLACRKKRHILRLPARHHCNRHLRPSSRCWYIPLALRVVGMDQCAGDRNQCSQCQRHTLFGPPLSPVRRPRNIHCSISSNRRCKR